LEQTKLLHTGNFHIVSGLDATGVWTDAVPVQLRSALLGHALSGWSEGILFRCRSFHLRKIRQNKATGCWTVGNTLKATGDEFELVIFRIWETSTVNGPGNYMVRPLFPYRCNVASLLWKLSSAGSISTAILEVARSGRNGRNGWCAFALSPVLRYSNKAGYFVKEPQLNVLNSAKRQTCVARDN
jgi:hypothetical protein